MNILNSAAQMIFIEMTFTLIIGLCLKQHLRDETVICLPWIIGLLLCCALIVLAYRYYKSEKTQQFDNIRDLLQGSIETEVYDMQDAYLRFKELPNVEIIQVSE